MPRKKSGDEKLSWTSVETFRWITELIDAAVAHPDWTQKQIAQHLKWDAAKVTNVKQAISSLFDGRDFDDMLSQHTSQFPSPLLDLQADINGFLLSHFVILRIGKKLKPEIRIDATPSVLRWFVPRFAVALRKYVLPKSEEDSDDLDLEQRSLPHLQMHRTFDLGMSFMRLRHQAVDFVIAPSQDGLMVRHQAEEVASFPSEQLGILLNSSSKDLWERARDSLAAKRDYWDLHFDDAVLALATDDVSKRAERLFPRPLARVLCVSYDEVREHVRSGTAVFGVGFPHRHTREATDISIKHIPFTSFRTINHPDLDYLRDFRPVRYSVYARDRNMDGIFERQSKLTREAVVACMREATRDYEHPDIH